MPEEKNDIQERNRRKREAAPEQFSDAWVERRESARKMREESARLQAERTEQENRQKERQARHEVLARQEDDSTRAKIFARYLQAEEEAKARAQAETPSVPLTTPRMNQQLLDEQAAGRRALERHRRHFETAAAARERSLAAEKAEEDATPAVPGFEVKSD